MTHPLWKYLYGAAMPKWWEMVLNQILGYSKSYRAYTLHYWFQSYGDFAELVDFTYWWSCIGNGLCLQPAQQARFFNWLPQKPMIYRNIVNFFLAYSTLLVNYSDFITANPKVLHITGFVLVLATPQGLNFNFIIISW